MDLWNAVNRGGGAIELIPKILSRVIEEDAWSEREYNGRILRNATFRDFITKNPMEGCGWDPHKVRHLLRYYPETLTLFEEYIAGETGTHTGPDNIRTTEYGTSLGYILRRLKKERPDLHARVCAGELSANAAAIEVGFRKIATPLAIIDRQLQKLTAEERFDLAMKIIKDLEGGSHD